MLDRLTKISAAGVGIAVCTFVLYHIGAGATGEASALAKIAAPVMLAGIACAGLLAFCLILKLGRWAVR